jgi:acetolactate synthase I/II/III large subunit
MNGADLLCDQLLAHGVNLCFANPGTSEMHFVAALDRKPELRCVLGLFEGVVTGAADGYARMARRPAATLLHTGPGLANGLANLHNARRAHSPIVNIVGDHAAYHLPLDAPLTSDIDSLARPMSSWIGRVPSAAQVPAKVSEAFTAACLLPGVATLILPADTAWSEAASTIMPAARPLRPRVDQSRVRDVAALIRRHRGRFAVLVGGEAALTAGTEYADRIARAFDGRVIAEMLPARVTRGRGRTSPPSIPYPVPLALAFLQDIELLVLVGASEPVAFFAYPNQPGRLLPVESTVTLLATVGEDKLDALEALADELGAKEGWTPPSREPLTSFDADGPLSADSLGEILARALPEDAIVSDEGVTGAARFRALAHQAAPHDTMSVTGGAIGIGIPLAIGAALACPDRKVINLQADGSALYTVQGLWTEARENLNVLTIILSNRAYAILKGELEALGVNHFGRNAERMMSLDQPALSWVRIAQGFGVEAVRAETIAQFREAVAVGMARVGPFLIECVL